MKRTLGLSLVLALGASMLILGASIHHSEVGVPGFLIMVPPLEAAQRYLRQQISKLCN